MSSLFINWNFEFHTWSLNFMVPSFEIGKNQENDEGSLPERHFVLRKGKYYLDYWSRRHKTNQINSSNWDNISFREPQPYSTIFVPNKTFFLQKVKLFLLSRKLYNNIFYYSNLIYMEIYFFTTNKLIARLCIIIFFQNLAVISER